MGIARLSILVAEIFRLGSAHTRWFIVYLGTGIDILKAVINKDILQKFGETLDGEFYTDDKLKMLYATDASAYREIPQAVAIPKNR